MKKILRLVEAAETVQEFRYITNHGVGPGTVPEGTFIRSEDLDSGKTAIYLNRALSNDELKKYDIKPEWIQESDEELQFTGNADRSAYNELLKAVERERSDVDKEVKIFRGEKGWTARITRPNGAVIERHPYDSWKTVAYGKVSESFEDDLDAAKADSKERGLYSESDKALGDEYREVASIIANAISTKYGTEATEEQIDAEIKDWLANHTVKEPLATDKLHEIISKKVGLTEALEDGESVNDEVEDLQDETPVEDEDDTVGLDTQLQELRDILPDLDLRLYQVTSKEDTSKVFYFIGKVAEDSDDVLMLVDNKPASDDEEISVMGEGSLKEDGENLPLPVSDDAENDTEEPERFDFIVIPSSYEEFIKLNPRYGDEITPDHEAIMEYLMQCLIEKNPDKAEELQSDKNENLEKGEE